LECAREAFAGDVEVARPGLVLDASREAGSNKAAGFVSYGALGGARAIEHLRGISGELQIADVRQQLSFSGLTDFEHFSVFRPGAYNEGLAAVMFDQLEAWAGALKQLRADSAAKAA
jgi:NAD(P)H-dependent FMN reductase